MILGLSKKCSKTPIYGILLAKASHQIWAYRSLLSDTPIYVQHLRDGYSATKPRFT